MAKMKPEPETVSRRNAGVTDADDSGEQSSVTAKTKTGRADDDAQPDAPAKVKSPRRATAGATRLVEMKNSPSGLLDRDAVMAALVDAVIELGGGGAATVDPATAIERNN